MYRTEAWVYIHRSPHISVCAFKNAFRSFSASPYIYSCMRASFLFRHPNGLDVVVLHVYNGPRALISLFSRVPRHISYLSLSRSLSLARKRFFILFCSLYMFIYNIYIFIFIYMLLRSLVGSRIFFSCSLIN